MSVEQITKEDVLINWPLNYDPLPPGYYVYYVDCVEHYMGFGPNDVESSIYSCRFDARRWCFNHYKEQKRKEILRQS